ncbi:sulfite exporter TauE/SafE family protein [Vibrio profundum]|uniref:sulfite exporter TauE/SafE family protein n=1 Tax=Vibrio profundum TaxID=2910247 RepID=UPI003D0EE007
MSFLNLMLSFLAIGLVGGFQFGLMGIGTGLLALPILLYLLPLMGISPDLVASVSIATVSATLALTSVSAVVSHLRYKTIHWSLVRKLAPMGIVGIFSGVALNAYLPVEISRKVLASLIILIAVKMLLETCRSEEADKRRPLPNYLHGAAWGLGVFTGMVGIANLVLLPFYNHYLGMKKAIGTAMASSLLFLTVTCLIYVVLGAYRGVGAQNPYLIGYMDWPAVLAMASAALLSAPLGVKLSHKLPVAKLKIAVSLMILVVALKLFFSA